MKSPPPTASRSPGSTSCLARYRREGEAVFEPRSRRPETNPNATPLEVVDLIVRLRKELADQGLDAGPDGRPGPDSKILSWLDDCSRYALSVTAHVRVTGPIVLTGFRRTVATHGIPASTLTDNAMVFTTRLSGGKGGRNHLETELRRLGVDQKNGRPWHPQTQGKVERFQQTMKKWLRAQLTQPATIADLQTLLDHFQDEYNQRRPHRSLEHRATPATIYTSRPKATPGDRTDDTHDRVRMDRVDKSGKITLRYSGQLYSIGIGRTHARTRVILLIQDLNIRIVDAATGELLRELVLDTSKRYQGTGRPPGPTR